MPLEKVEAPLPGKIISISVKVGEKIAELDQICTIEAMKMENPIVSSVSGIVKELNASEGKLVKAGDILALIEY
jgi:biotin carboxyl carrier protein